MNSIPYDIPINFSPDYLILMLTDACNLECAYCYLGKHKSSHTMAPSIIDRAIDLALASGTPFHVQLSGGEPTLVPQAVCHAAQRLRTLSPTSTLGLQTNATCIDKAMADMMLRFHMDVGVSLDGPPHIQEKLRGKAKETFQGLQYL
ncbi:MAG: radical SAM protein, partial [Desulfobacterium sp.]